MWITYRFVGARAGNRRVGGNLRAMRSVSNSATSSVSSRTDDGMGLISSYGTSLKHTLNAIDTHKREKRRLRQRHAAAAANAGRTTASGSNPDGAATKRDGRFSGVGEDDSLFSSGSVRTLQRLQQKAEKRSKQQRLRSKMLIHKYESGQPGAAMARRGAAAAQAAQASAQAALHTERAESVGLGGVGGSGLLFVPGLSGHRVLVSGFTGRAGGAIRDDALVQSGIPPADLTGESVDRLAEAGLTSASGETLHSERAREVAIRRAREVSRRRGDISEAAAAMAAAAAAKVAGGDVVASLAAGVLNAGVLEAAGVMDAGSDASGKLKDVDLRALPAAKETNSAVACRGVAAFKTTPRDVHRSRGDYRVADSGPSVGHYQPRYDSIQPKISGGAFVTKVNVDVRDAKR